MLERLIAWRGKRVGVQWFTGPTGASEAELAAQRQARVDRAVLSRYERELADVPVVPGDDWPEPFPSRPLPQNPPFAWFLVAVLGMVAAAGAWRSAEDGEWGLFAVCLVLLGACARVVCRR